MTLDLILYIILGIFTGFCAGLFGLGGGAIVVPFLLLLFSRLQIPSYITMHMAEGSALAAMLFTSLSATYKHHKSNNILWPVFKMMIGYVLIGVILGAILAWWLHGYGLTAIFALYVLFISIKMLMGAKISIPTTDNNRPHEIPRHNMGGISIGGAAGLLGIGGGTFAVPFLSHAKIDMKHAVGTSVSFTFPIAVVGTIAYIISGYLHSENIHIALSSGFVYWPAALTIGISSACIAPLGVKATNFLPSYKIKKYFGYLMLIIFACLVWHLVAFHP